MSESASTTGKPGRAGRDPRGTGSKRGMFARVALFLRQVIAELKKVVRPSRTELWTYFVVVIVFVLAIMAYIGLVDLGLGQLITWVFGR